MPTPAVYRPAPAIRKARFQTAPFGPAKSPPRPAKAVTAEAASGVKSTGHVVTLVAARAAQNGEKT